MARSRGAIRDMSCAALRVIPNSGSQRARFIMLGTPSERNYQGMTMEKPTQQPREPQKVKCEVCRKEIPRSDAQSAEAAEYVVYFCGFDCFHQWKTNRQTPQSRDPDRGPV
jgi:hypothetical protein